MHVMNIMKSKWASLTLTLFVVGCAPFPHNHYHAPTIKGVATINGLPATNTKVYLASAIKMTSCDDTPLTSTTNENGEFEIGPITKFRYLVLLYGDPYEIWELCIDYKGQRKQLLQFDAHSSPSNLEVKCELTREEEVYFEEVRGLSGLCDVNNS